MVLVALSVLHPRRRKATVIQRYLLFDSTCSVCSGLARDVEKHSDGRLDAQSLYDSKIQQLLDKATPNWPWEPTVLEVEDGRPRAYTGLSMRIRLLYVLGPRSSWRIARLMARTQIVHISDSDSAPKNLIKKVGGTLAGVTGLSFSGAGAGAAAVKETVVVKSIEDLPQHARREGVRAISDLQSADEAEGGSRATGRTKSVQFTHSTSDRSGKLISEVSDARDSFQLVRNGRTVVKVTMDKIERAFDIEDSSGRSTHFIFTEDGVVSDEGIGSEDTEIVQQNRDDLTLAASVQADLAMLDAPIKSPPSKQDFSEKVNCQCRPSLNSRGSSYGASKSSACQGARDDANTKCSNCSCLGCCGWLSATCDCACGVGDYVCSCGITGFACDPYCLPQCR